MSGPRSIWRAALAAVLCGMWLIPAALQAAEGPPEGGPGGRRARDPEEMRRRMEEFRQRRQEQLMEQLKCSADEWKVIGPRIEAVQTAQRNTMGGRGFGMFGGRMGRGGPGGRERPGSDREPETELGKKTLALQQLLEKEDAKAADIKTALTELRAVRKKAQDELTAARAKLKEVLNQRQEAMLVLQGMLE